MNKIGENIRFFLELNGYQTQLQNLKPSSLPKEAELIDFFVKKCQDEIEKITNIYINVDKIV